MRRAVGTVCLTVGVMLIMTMIASPSYCQDVVIKLRWDNPNSKCEIDIDPKGNRFKGVCRSGNHPDKCDTDQLTWTVQNENCTNHGFGVWKLAILDAPGHPSCFRPNENLPIGVVEEITQAGNEGAKSSGQPHVYCSQDKYGTYWPYVLTLYEEVSGNWVPKDTTDPGGIIFP